MEKDSNKMSEEEFQKELKRLFDIQMEQSKIMKKQTGRGMYERVKTDGKGTIIFDSDDKVQRKVWDVEE
ncbi:hypothetical protein GLW04_19370 [Halobacillus litoralis]|uniref:Uncharacterized protein n=1 Tax=Halobacillus litoralis TaxID=45668 RepID=A0A845DYB7_9BACI|nr:hypothetical protein [Halobacillus litoralis]MYL22038.1 hypothetical protein [Halobacillus litoralis]